jgi:hypothetical protein
MYRLLLLLFFVAFTNNLSAQIKNNGFNNFKWGQDKSTFTSLKNCNSKLSGEGFENCEIVNADSTFYKKIKYQFISARFYKNKLAELQIDIHHKDLSKLIADLTIDLGAPTIKEKRLASIDGDEQTIGYIWNVGDTHLLIINDGVLSPAIVVLSSKKIKSQYPSTTLSLEKLIFE